MKWLGREDVPLTLRPSAIPGLGLWGLRFLANCRKGKYRRTALALTRLGQASLEELNGLLDGNLVDAKIWTGGHLEIFRGPHAVEEAGSSKRFLEDMGAETELLDARGCVALEPTLEPVRSRIGAGLVLKKDAWGDARLFRPQPPPAPGASASISATIAAWTGSRPRAAGSVPSMRTGSGWRPIA